MSKLLTVNDLARVLSCSAATAYSIVQSGQIAAVKVHKRMWRIREESVEEFLRSGSGASKPGPRQA